jgi:hypothetical protein
MSKYALPGMFHLPESNHPISIGANDQFKSTSVLNEKQNSDIIKCDNIQTRPRYTSSHFGRYVQQNVSPFFESCMEEKLDYNRKDETTDFTIGMPKSLKFDIVVNKVLIDWVQYVKSSSETRNIGTSNNKQSSASSRREKNCMRRTLGTDDETRNRISRRRQRVVASNVRNLTQDETDSNDTTMPSVLPLENAIKFELGVLCNGQSYNVVRSLGQIRQLHEELVHISTLYSEDNLKLRNIVDNEDQLRHTQCDEKEIDKNFSIPAIPELLNSMNTFTNLQSLYGQMIQSYAPTIEKWFRTVFEIVPSNLQTSVSYFFYEPIITIVTHCNTVATSSRFPSLMPRRIQKKLSRRQRRQQHGTALSNNLSVGFNPLEIIEEEKLETDDDVVP